MPFSLETPFFLPKQFPFRLLADFILNGVLKTEGIQLLGQVLGFLIQTDKTEHVNIPILLPFCRFSFYDCTGIPPFHLQQKAEQAKLNLRSEKLASTAFSRQHKEAIATLFDGYMTSMVEHLHTLRTKMNGLQKFIKRQERTRGEFDLKMLNIQL